MYSKEEARRLLYGGGYEGENQCTAQFERAIVHETESLALARVGANALAQLCGPEFRLIGEKPGCGSASIFCGPEFHD